MCSEKRVIYPVLGYRIYLYNNTVKRLNTPVLALGINKMLNITMCLHRKYVYKFFSHYSLAKDKLYTVKRAKNPLGMFYFHKYAFS